MAGCRLAPHNLYPGRCCLQDAGNACWAHNCDITLAHSGKLQSLSDLLKYGSHATITADIIRGRYCCRRSYKPVWSLAGKHDLRCKVCTEFEHWHHAMWVSNTCLISSLHLPQVCTPPASPVVSTWPAAPELWCPVHLQPACRLCKISATCCPGHTGCLRKIL